MHALIYLPFLKDAYLLVVRHVDPKVFGYYHRTKVAVSEYDRLDAEPFAGPAHLRRALYASCRL